MSSLPSEICLFCVLWASDSALKKGQEPLYSPGFGDLAETKIQWLPVSGGLGWRGSYRKLKIINLTKLVTPERKLG
jgi:hypothetical protein